MKYLLSWVCKHLQIDSWKELGSIEEIIKKLTTHLSEIAQVEKIDYSNQKISFATIISNNNDICIAQYNDEKRVINLPYRIDAEAGLVYLIIQYEENKYRFATMKDLYAESKNHPIPAVYGNITDDLNFLKKIKKNIDYVIKIDNTSISNRPDLFSHRGLAREISLLFNKELIPENEILFNKKNIKKINNKDSKIFTINSSSINSAIAFTGLFNERESQLSYIFDITPLDITPHSYLIDLSNYIMLDIGQPIHIFDKKKIIGNLNFTDSTTGELECLDHTTITIERKNNVISVNNEIHSLVGIIGGKKSSVNIKTKEIIVESVYIEKKNIQYSMKYYNKKTESAIRNEKGSSNESIEVALLRFLKLINNNFQFQIDEYQHYKKSISSNKKINLSLIYSTKVIGISIELTIIEKILTKLGFNLNKINQSISTIIEVEIPWWRLDINNQDDLIEEIVRHVGFDNLPSIAPRLECKGIVKKNNIENLKKNTILITEAHEIISYGIANEEQKEKYSFISNKKELIVRNDYSHRQKYMTSSFLPNFLDITNKEMQKGKHSISLFEINPIWHINNNENKEEIYYTISMSNINNDYNFYHKSQLLKKIFYDLEYDIYFKPIDEEHTLNHNLFSAIASHIYYDSYIIGTCGFIDPIKLYKENKKNSAIFAAEINLSLLFSMKKIPLLNNKYPFFDISILIEKNNKINKIVDQLKIAFGAIMHIKIIDWFESIEWINNRSITIRIFLMNNDINDLYEEIKRYLIERNYKIR